MVHKYGITMLICAIFAAVMVAGCASSGPNEGPAGSPGETTLNSLINTSGLQWYEYTTNVSTAGQTFMSHNIKMNYGIDYNGTLADKYTMNMFLPADNGTTNSLIEIYVDHGNHTLLGAHLAMMESGNLTEKDLPPMSGSDGRSPDLMDIYGKLKLVSAGNESVSVPAGTYVAEKYSGTNNGTVSCVWIAPSVPVPVKVTEYQQGMMTVTELVGYG